MSLTWKTVEEAVAIDQIKSLCGMKTLEATLSLVEPLNKPAAENKTKIKDFSGLAISQY